MAPQAVSLHQVGEDQAVELLTESLQQQLDAMSVVPRMNAIRDTPTTEDIVDLADAVDSQASLCRTVQQRWPMGLHGEVPPVLGPLEAPRLPHERPGDDPPHRVLPHQEPTSDAAPLVEPVHRRHVAVRGHLEDAVSRCVDDRAAGPKMLLAESLDDLGARSGHVTENSAPYRRLESPYERCRESVGVGGEGCLNHEPHQLPVPRGGVLPRGPLTETPPKALRLVRGRDPEDIGDIAQAKRAQVGQRQAPDGAGRVPEGVRALIAIGMGVRQSAAAHSVQDDDNGPQTQSSSGRNPSNSGAIIGGPLRASSMARR